MTKKPSLTKQIADQFGTENKQEQLELLGDLIRVAKDIPMAVTVLFTRGIPFTVVSAPTKVNTKEVKAILTLAIEQLTRMEVKDELEKADLGPDPMEVIPPDEID